MNIFEKKKVLLICSLVLICLGLSFWQSKPAKLEEDMTAIASNGVKTEVKGVKICVSGAVVKPGLYEVPAGSRAVDAIAIAGGMTADANVEKVNLAKICKDGTQVKVPFNKGKRKTYSGGGNTPVGNNDKAYLESEAGNVQQNEMGIININTAEASELEQLPGVGPATAAKIIAYRKDNGFSTIEDIMKVKGIGPAKFAKMKDRLGV